MCEGPMCLAFVYVANVIGAAAKAGARRVRSTVTAWANTIADGFAVELPWPYDGKDDMNKGQDMVHVRTMGNGAYTISRAGYELECRAKREGAAAKRAGVDFHDNPYRHGPVTPEDALYSAWEYGYMNGDSDAALGIVEG